MKAAINLPSDKNEPAEEEEEEEETASYNMSYYEVTFVPSGGELLDIYSNSIH